LVLPAHDYILKCSHTFNILDTRGAVGVTERQALFAKMRDLAHKVSVAYAEQRQQLEYPFLDQTSATPIMTTAKPALPVITVDKADFLLEIGTEELPAADLQSALEQLTSRVPQLLDEQRLPHGEIKVVGTPRRLVVMVNQLATRQQEKESLVKGPPANRAYDAAGQPTRAAEGFAQSRGLTMSELQTREIDGGTYLVAMVKEPTRSACEVLLENLPALAAGIKFEKTMRWNSSNVAFSRPVRWLLAILDGNPIPFEYAGLVAANITHGLRLSDPSSAEVRSIGDYQTYLSNQGILLDPAERKAAIREGVVNLLKSVGASLKVDEGLLEEVNSLVEAPTPLLGKFDPQHLELPAEVLTSVMKKHQRYFPVTSTDGKLMPYFIAVRNGNDIGLDVVANGNEQVIKARFADAHFFINEDLKHKLSDMLDRLGTLTFQQKLGSMRDKSRRIETLTASLTDALNFTVAEKETALRTAQLCKADLVTHMVVEMTSLQGIMGRYYALHSGESREVAQAIFEHYLPRFAGDVTPSSRAGLVVGIADRLDTLVGLFAAGLAPTGTKDPFAQRRAALGLVQLLAENDLSIDLQYWMQVAEKALPLPMSDENRKACFEFVVGRLKSNLNEQGYRYDVVDAVLAEKQNDPAAVFHAVDQLTKWTARSDWQSILPAYARCVRITRDLKESFTIDPAKFVESAEKDLYQALLAAENGKGKVGTVDAFLNAFLPMIPAVNQFFDAVLVMAEDLQVRNNRLGLLQRIAQLAKGAAELSCLEGF
jgi:glycyl-tRNA synthetase